MQNSEQKILSQFYILVVCYWLQMEMTSSCLWLSSFFLRLYNC